jgi:thiol peroxidase
MKERKGIVTMKGNAVTLVGTEVKVGDAAPDFTVVDNDLGQVSLSTYRGKICVISSVPSLDTPVCELQTKVFNERASQLDENIVILTISMDLPFAQKRWCAAQGVDRVQTLSDHRDASFGMSFGVLIKEVRLLARAVFVVDPDGIIRYVQIVSEVTTEPDYEEIWETLKALG